MHYYTIHLQMYVHLANISKYGLLSEKLEGVAEELFVSQDALW